MKTLDAADALPAFVTLLRTDLVGWQHILVELGDDDAALVAHAYQDFVIDGVRAEGGRALELAGDQTLAMFSQPRAALRAAVWIRETSRRERWALHLDPPAVRFAVHSGHTSRSDRAAHSARSR